jgi:cell division protein FtsA
MSGQIRDKNYNHKSISAALDVGTDKIVCIIAKNHNFYDSKKNSTIEIIGIGHNQSKGVRAGNIVDLNAVEDSIRTAIEAAESMAGVTIDQLIVNVSSNNIESAVYEVGVPIHNSQVNNKDVQTALHASYGQELKDDKTKIHTIPLGFSIDGIQGILDPIGMYGQRLNINMHIITTDTGPLRNLNLVVERAHAKISKMIVSPLASAVATLSIDEADLGTICIDMGAGCTSFCLFVDGMLQYADAIPIGGRDVTLDIAKQLSTPIIDAEKLKVLYGGVLSHVYETGDLINIPLVGEGEKQNLIQKVPKPIVADIVRPRVTEIFELIKERLNNISNSLHKDKRIILTGGMSQLTGVDELAAQIFGGPVRRAVPRNFSNDINVNSPIFSTAVGMLIFAQNDNLIIEKLSKEKKVFKNS